MCDFCSRETLDLIFYRRDFTRPVIMRDQTVLVETCQFHTLTTRGR